MPGHALKMYIMSNFILSLLSSPLKKTLKKKYKLYYLLANSQTDLIKLMTADTPYENLLCYRKLNRFIFQLTTYNFKL